MATKKKSTTKKSSSVSVERMRSFRRYPTPKPFFVLKMTQQTFYWAIIGLLVLALGVWVIVLTMRVQDIYNRTATQDTLNETSVSHANY